MTERACRDCGRLGNEDPDDPAPALCAACYKQRLLKLTEVFLPVIDQFMARDDFDGNITPLIVRFAQLLEEVAGETREYARIHANYLGHQMVLQQRSN